MGIKIDDKDFKNKIKDFGLKMPKATRSALGDVAFEILRLSQMEVPHDTGMLQNSGVAEPEKDGWVVGYNKVYASRLHEHPEYRFQKGRKGKYLEDPIKNNIMVFRKYLVDGLHKAL